MAWEVIDIFTHEDERGLLSVVEKVDSFDFKRMYYLYGSQTRKIRGDHAHKELKQIMVAVTGHCKITFEDKERREEVFLDRPNKGVIVYPVTWREITEISPDCVLVVLASDYYSEDDYIRDYNDFKSWKDS